MRPVYCDESIWIPVADGLRRRGWIVYTARDEGRLGDPDREHLSYAVDNDWIPVTFDDDFLSLAKDPDSNMPESSMFNRTGVTSEMS